MTNQYAADLTKERRKELGALPARGFGESMKTRHAVNLRVFPDVDFKKLPEPGHGDGATKITPPYVNP